MSALGQKRTCAVQNGMSALPPKADMCGARCPLCANSGHCGEPLNGGYVANIVAATTHEWDTSTPQRGDKR